MTNYSITSKAGQSMGVFEATSDVEAVAIMHREAGYDVAVGHDGTYLVFASDEDEALCGDLDAWIVREVG